MTNTRQIPQIYKIFMLITIIAGIGIYFIINNSKISKATKILHHEGYKNIKNVVVFATHEFLNDLTNIKGDSYSVRFNNSLKQTCQGFVYLDYKQNYKTDLECK